MSKQHPTAPAESSRPLISTLPARNGRSACFPTALTSVPAEDPAKPWEGCLHELFEAQVVRTPGKCALEVLPRTPNGKVDRARLPEPEWNGVRDPDAYVAPRTLTEKMLVEIWQGVLKVEAICIHDNFFDLGGHSLLAMQMVSRVRKNFNVEVPLQTVFEVPTVAGLSRTLEVLLHSNQKLMNTSKRISGKRTGIRL